MRFKLVRGGPQAHPDTQPHLGTLCPGARGRPSLGSLEFVLLRRARRVLVQSQMDRPPRWPGRLTPGQQAAIEPARARDPARAAALTSAAWAPQVSPYYEEMVRTIPAECYVVVDKSRSIEPNSMEREQ